MNIDELRDFASRYTAAWCSQDAASVAAFFAEDGSLTINDGEAAIGRAAITADAQGFMTAFPDMVVQMDGLVVDADRVVYQWTLSGTNTGPGGTGNPVRISGYEEWTIAADGLIARSLGHFDAAEYQRQLNAGAMSSDEHEVRDLVSDFLVALAEHRLDEIPAMFAPGASIGVVRLRDGVWTSSTKSFEDWYEPIRNAPPYEPYQEPVSEWSVRVEQGRMAFVRADALILANGTTRSRNIDYFTLMKLDGLWKFLSASYVATPTGDAEVIDDEAAVLAAEAAWVQAEIDGDAATLRRVIDEEFRLNRGDGTIAGKEELISMVTTWSMTNQQITERSVVVSGDTAVVFGTAELFFATDDGGESSSLLRYTTTWVRRGEQWRAVALHMSERAQPQ